MNGGSGPSLPESFASLDPDTRLWRTSQGCLLSGWATYSETWPRSGMMRNGGAYRQPPLVRHTGEIASGLWPTPTASLHNLREDPESWTERRQRTKERVRNGNGFGLPLTMAVKMWPTPTSRDWRSESCTEEVYEKREAQPRGKSLAWAVRYPTPNTVDAKGGTRRGKGQAQLCHLIGGSLNPTWVEWLMGFPLGWTDLEPSATP